MGTRQQSPWRWSEHVWGAPTSSSKLSCSPRPCLGEFTFPLSLQADGNQNPVNQFAGKALRYDAMSMAVTSVPGRPPSKLWAPPWGKGAGVGEGCVHQSHFTRPPTSQLWLPEGSQVRIEIRGKTKSGLGLCHTLLPVKARCHQDLSSIYMS